MDQKTDQVLDSVPSWNPGFLLGTQGSYDFGRRKIGPVPRLPKFPVDSPFLKALDVHGVQAANVSIALSVLGEDLELAEDFHGAGAGALAVLRHRREAVKGGETLPGLIVGVLADCDEDGLHQPGVNSFCLRYVCLKCCFNEFETHITLLLSHRSVGTLGEARRSSSGTGGVTRPVPSDLAVRQLE